jgi:hypothetical protein
VSDPRRPDGPGNDVPGDTGAADIVAPTGESRPAAGHDEVDAPRRAPAPPPQRGNLAPGTKPALLSDGAADA